MSETTFQASVRSLPGLASLDLSGDIDAFAEEALHSAYAEAERHGPATILLNLSRVRYINSTGIALIVGLLSRARQAQRSLAVCGLNEHYQEIFRITRLTDFVTVYPDEESALHAAQSAS
jgi:anti-anti-sigma factor